MLPFEESEYRDRLAETKSRMEDRGIDALVTGSPEHMYYLTGYRLWSHQNPQCVIVLLNRDEPILLVRDFDKAGAKKTTWVRDDSVRSYSSHRREVGAYIEGRVDHPMVEAGEILREHGCQNETVGVEKATHYYSARSHEALTSALPRATFEDATLLLINTRTVKSDAEIQHMKEAATLTQRGMEAALETIEDGASQSTVAASISQAMIEGTDDVDGDYFPQPPLLPSGELSGVAHHTWLSDESFSDGDAIAIEISGSRKQYHAGMSRTVYVGDPPAEVRENAELVVDGLETIIDTARAGMSCKEVAEAYRAELSVDVPEADMKFGYSGGLGISPVWTEDGGPALRPDDDTVLKPNMVLHAFPDYNLKGLDNSIEISEFVRITEGGAESLFDFPRRLFVR